MLFRSPERVSEVLGLTGIETVYKTAVAVARGDVAGLFRIVETVSSSAKDIAVYWQELTSFWRDMLVTKHLKENAAAYLDMTEPEMRVLTDAARRFDTAALTAHFTLLDEALKEMNRLPQTKRLTAEMTLIRMSDPRLSDTPAGYMARLNALEDKVTMLSQGIPLQAAAEPAEIPAAEAVPETISVKPAEAPAAPAAVQTAVPEVQIEPIPDISEVVERFTGQEPMAGAFLGDADCAISTDGKTIYIKTTGSFGERMLSENNVKASLLASFRMCGFGQAGTELVISSGAAPKEKKKPLDELEEAEY